MNIDRVGGVGKTGYETKNTGAKQKAEKTVSADNISISETARKQAAEAKLLTEVKTITKKIIQSPEDTERTEKIKEIKAKIQNGDYDELSPEILDKIADRVADSFLG